MSEMQQEPVSKMPKFEEEFMLAGIKHTKQKDAPQGYLKGRPGSAKYGNMTLQGFLAEDGTTYMRAYDASGAVAWYKVVELQGSQEAK